MNHRYGKRVTVQVEVVMHRHGHELGRYRTRDVSPYGVFLETGPMELDLCVSVDLTFLLSNESADRQMVKGLVVRRTSDGIGFIYADHSRQLFTRLKDIALDAPQTTQYPQSKKLKMLRKPSKSNNLLVSGRLFK